MENIFSEWSNQVPKKIIIGVGMVVVALIVGVTYYMTPKYANVGYQPIQPVAFDHSLHAGQLRIDCRYCHTYVNISEHSNISDANTCMNCHSHIKTGSLALAPIRDSYKSGLPVNWVKVHKTPDYVYFNHSVHVNRGVSCVECHGKVNEMDVVYQSKSLTMAFCLDCHRNPEERIRPLLEVYNLNWKAGSVLAQKEMGRKFVHDWKINVTENCSVCHR